MKSVLSIILASICSLPAFAGVGTRKAIDPDEAYKNNCMRCHSAVRQYSPRMTATIVTHMRIRANLTAEETQAILQYLTENAPAKTPPATAYGGR